MWRKVLKPDAYTRVKYCDMIREVFSEMAPERIRETSEKFDEMTRFYVIGEEDEYYSLVFLTEVVIGPVRFGGVGGVATKKMFRGKGYAGELIKRVIEDTRGVYPALLLWTRIPEFFERIGFQDASGYFQEDAAGSVPMIYFHEPRATVFRAVPGKLPRVYF